MKLPKFDSEEWQSLNVSSKLDLLNEAVQSLLPKEETPKKKVK